MIDMKLGRFLIAVPLVFAAACGDDGAAPKDAPVAIDAGTQDPACFTNPKTYNEIINACTTAIGVPKTPVLPLLNADGTLPDLP